MRIRTDAAQRGCATGAGPLHVLDDRDFEDAVLSNAHPPTRDSAGWAELTRPEMIRRTREALAAMRARNHAAIARKKANLTAVQAACLRRGPDGRNEYLEAKAEFERWKSGASNFDRTVGAAIDEVNDIARGSSGVLHGLLVRALTAIRIHRDACHTAQTEPQAHDIALWRTLEERD